MKMSFSVSGVNETQRVFANLPRTTQNKAGQQALRAGGLVVRDAAVRNIKAITSKSNVSTGVLAKGLRVYKFKKKQGMIRAGVMVKKGLVNERKRVKGAPVRVGLYASVLEFGKANQPPRPWLRPALIENDGKVRDAVRVELLNRMDDAVRAAK